MDTLFSYETAAHALVFTGYLLLLAFDFCVALCIVSRFIRHVKRRIRRYQKRKRIVKKEGTSHE